MTGLNLPTLLVITELPPVRYWVKGQLDKQFYLIDAATEKKALETVQTAHLDFIILDASIEECNPIQLCTKIRNLALYDPFPIFLITGRLKKSYREEALAAGVTDFLSDQLDNEELQQRIAAGKKAAEIRQKVEDLSTKIAKTKAEISAAYSKTGGQLSQRMVQFLDAAKKGNKHVTMLVGQIDEFAAIQEKYGLSTADEIIAPLSDLLNRSAQGQEIINPTYDGGFIILLTGTSPLEAKNVAQRLQKTIHKHLFSTKLGSLQITASFTLSKVDATESSVNKMIRIAGSSLKENPLQKSAIFNLEAEKKK